MVLILMNS